MEEIENNLEQSASDSGTQSEAAAPQSASELVDLSKHEKFMFDGKEYTKDEFKKGWMRQQDYTRKTQEAAELRRQADAKLAEQEQKYQNYVDNVEADVNAVIKDPSLYAKFKEIYPKSFHSFLDRSLQRAAQGGTSSNSYEQTSQRQRDPYLEARINGIEATFKKQEEAKAAEVFQSEVAASSAMLDNACESLAKKFPFAVEDAVLSRAEQLVASMKGYSNEAFKEALETLYKESHDSQKARYDLFYKEQVSKQKQANKSGKDMGPGGGIPAQAPARPMKMKDVKHHMLEKIRNGEGL